MVQLNIKPNLPNKQLHIASILIVTFCYLSLICPLFALPQREIKTLTMQKEEIDSPFKELFAFVW